MRVCSILIIVILFNLSCNKNNKATSDVASIYSQLLASIWQVHYLYFNRADYTSHYSRNHIVFAKDSVVHITSATLSATGRWFISKQQDRSVELFINDFSSASMPELSNNWKISSNDGTLIVLTDYNSADSRELHFIRE